MDLSRSTSHTQLAAGWVSGRAAGSIFAGVPTGAIVHQTDYRAMLLFHNNYKSHIIIIITIIIKNWIIGQCNSRVLIG